MIPLEEILLFIATGDEDKETKLEKISKYLQQLADDQWNEGYGDGLNA